jgi:hypothetical protein
MSRSRHFAMWIETGFDWPRVEPSVTQVGGPMAGPAPNMGQVLQVVRAFGRPIQTRCVGLSSASRGREDAGLTIGIERCSDDPRKLRGSILHEAGVEVRLLSAELEKPVPRLVRGSGFLRLERCDVAALIQADGTLLTIATIGGGVPPGPSLWSDPPRVVLTDPETALGTYRPLGVGWAVRTLDEYRLRSRRVVLRPAGPAQAGLRVITALRKRDGGFAWGAGEILEQQPEGASQIVLDDDVADLPMTWVTSEAA